MDRSVAYLLYGPYRGTGGADGIQRVVNTDHIQVRRIHQDSPVFHHISVSHRYSFHHDIGTRNIYTTAERSA